MRSRRGASAIEFAMVLPLLVYVAMGTLEYSWFLYQRTQVVHAVREGVRLAAVSEVDDSPAPDALAAARAADVLDERGFASGDVTLATSYLDLTGDVAGTLDTLTLNATVVYQPIAGGLVPTPASMAVTMSMMLQGAE